MVYCNSCSCDQSERSPKHRLEQRLPNGQGALEESLRLLYGRPHYKVALSGWSTVLGAVEAVSPLYGHQRTVFVLARAGLGGCFLFY